MIAKQNIGTSFRGVLNYLEQKLKQGVGEKIGSNMLGDNAKTLAKEFELISAMKPNLTKKVYHTSISISPEEKLTNEQFQEIGEKYLNKMGFGNSQFVIYRHKDTEHPHIHVVTNRIDLSGQVVSDRWNYRQSEKIIRELEKEYGLKEAVSSNRVEDKALSKGQIENFKRTKQIPAKTQLQIITKEALTSSISISDFEFKMNQSGANVMFHKNNSGKIFGLSFELDGVKFKASQLGKAYSWNRIKVKLNYERDQGIGSKESRGTNTDIRSTGRTLAEYEQEKYSRANRGSFSNNEQYQTVSDSSEGRVESGSRTAGDLSEDSSFSRAKDESVGIHGSGNEKIDSVYESENISGSNSSWESNRSPHISNSIFLPQNSIGGDEDDEFEKKRKKRKRRGISR